MRPILPFTLLSAATIAQSTPVLDQTLGNPNLPTLHSRQDDVETWDYNVTTRIQYFTGCSDEQIKTIRQAWKDAMMLAGAIGDPEELKPDEWLVWEYFGDYWKVDSGEREKYWSNIKGMYIC